MRASPPPARTAALTTTTTTTTAAVVAAAATATATAIDPSHITINSSCIISINNPNNNNTTRNNNIIYPDQYSASSDSGMPPKSSSQASATQTTNNPYSYSPHPASRDSPPHTLSPAVPSTTPSCIIIPSTPPKETQEMQEKTYPKETKMKVKNSKEAPESGRKSLKAVEEGLEAAGSNSSGPSSLSAPCSPAKPLLRKTEAVDLEEYDYCKCGTGRHVSHTQLWWLGEVSIFFSLTVYREQSAS